MTSLSSSLAPRTPASQAEDSRKSGRVVLLSILGFFMTFICVNMFFAYKALSTYTGVVVENAYEKGLHFNQIIAEAKKRQQEALHAPDHSHTPPSADPH